MKKSSVTRALVHVFACITFISPSIVDAQTCAIKWWGDWTGAVPTNETGKTAQACNEVFQLLFNNTPDCSGPCYVPGTEGGCEDTFLPEGCIGWGEYINILGNIQCENEIVCDTGEWSKHFYSFSRPSFEVSYFYEGYWDVLCGVDTDSDGIPDNADTCIVVYNPLQEDADGDGIGDACDNCPDSFNSGQDDYDQDAKGDACDNCPNTQNINQEDTDEDGIGNVCDNCPNNSNSTQEDVDEDGFGDACDQCANDPYNDIDSDGVCGDVDNCASKRNGPNGGICIYGTLGEPCSFPGFNPMECGDSGYCSMAQEDFYPPGGNGIGDACDCEGNFNCSEDQDVDGSDASSFKADFGRSAMTEPCTGEIPCNGDFNCDGDADGTDAALFKSDFGRSGYNNPCPACEIGEWCDYSVSPSTSTTMPATTTSTVSGITTTTLPITTSTVPGTTTTIPIITTTVPGTTTTLPVTTTTVPGTTTTTSPAQCELRINSASEIVYTWEHIQFSTTLDGVCNPPCYSWAVVSNIGSTIDNIGFYTAGGSAGIDTVEVRDNCNTDTFDSAVVEVVSFTTTVPPTTTMAP